jgi:hypothetical protein
MEQGCNQAKPTSDADCVYAVNTAEDSLKIPSIRFIMKHYTIILCLDPVASIAAPTLSGTRDLLLCITRFLIFFAMLLSHGTSSRAEIPAATAA